MSKVNEVMVEGIDLFDKAVELIEEMYVEDGGDVQIRREDYEMTINRLWKGLWSYIGSKGSKLVKGKKVELNLKDMLIIGADYGETKDAEGGIGNITPYIMIGDKFAEIVGSEPQAITKFDKKEYEKALVEATVRGKLEKLNQENRTITSTLDALLETRFRAMAEFIAESFKEAEEGESVSATVKEGEYFIIEATSDGEDISYNVTVAPLAKLAVKDNAATEE